MWSFIYPGQGSQKVGMGKSFYENFSFAKIIFEEASDALSLNMTRLCFEDPDDLLNLTEYTQPALLTVSMAMDAVLRRETPYEEAKYRAGHSLGEYSALVSAGILRLDQAVRAVRQRGQEMQKAVPEGIGGMVACLGAENSQVDSILKWLKESFQDGILEAANFNSPGQVVLSGHMSAIDFLIENYDAKKLGHEKNPKLIKLKVSAPFHCSLMKPAQSAMQPVLEDLTMSDSPCWVVQNFSAKENFELDQIRKDLTSQITAPVKWSQSIEYMKSNGVTHFVEVGPGNVLTGLNKKIDRDKLKSFTIDSPESITEIAKAMKG